MISAKTARNKANKASDTVNNVTELNNYIKKATELGFCNISVLVVNRKLDKFMTQLEEKGYIVSTFNEEGVYDSTCLEIEWF